MLFLCTQKIKKKEKMGAFAIYAFVVTGLYILYMSAVIMKDLFGKKGQKKEAVEEFNTADVGEESSTVIDETEDGFHIHQEGEAADDAQQAPEEEEHPEDHGSDASRQGNAREVAVPEGSVPQEDQEQPVDDNPDDETLLEEESEASQAEYERVIAVKKEMQSVKPSYPDEYTSDEFLAKTSIPLSEQSRILCNMIGNI